MVPTSEEAVEPTDDVIEAAKLDETPALTTPADTDTADEAEDDANDAGSEPSAEDEATKDDEPAKDDAPTATSPRPLTRPIVLPEINVAELGVADRLGLSDFDDDDEVGPTS